ncbi:MAG: HAD-IA family hydrolase, partial [Acetobacteraceae bacterium]|nr:HAD-IA family hydrolase [Acetobacteraceae bacterium]
RGRGIRTAILSNGEPRMLAEAVEAGRLTSLLDEIISVEDAGVFKPDPRVYALAEQRLGLPAIRMAFVSSNAWDAQAAARNGFRVFWCNRGGNPVEYGLERSASVIAGLGELDMALA